jgi:hypothetical protein
MASNGSMQCAYRVKKYGAKYLTAKVGYIHYLVFVVYKSKGKQKYPIISRI